jgi:triacylglycerol lipase
MPTFDFDYRAKGHSPKNALRLGEAAAAAYGSADQVRQWAEARGLESRFFDKDNVQGFTARNADLQMVCFRGTSDPADWGINLDAIPESAGDARLQGLLHRGFHRALMRVWDPFVAPELASSGPRRIWITGHSLGGALAALAAAETRFIAGAPLAGLYTFGQPRIGDEQFANQFDSALRSVSFRYVNDKDIVPRVPLYTAGYRHVGEEFFLLATGELQQDPRLEVKIRNFLSSKSGSIQADILKALASLDNLVDSVLNRDLAEAFRKIDFKGDLKALFARGVEGIEDHSMPGSYLPRLRKLAGIREEA